MDCIELDPLWPKLGIFQERFFKGLRFFSPPFTAWWPPNTSLLRDDSSYESNFLLSLQLALQRGCGHDRQNVKLPNDGHMFRLSLLSPQNTAIMRWILVSFLLTAHFPIRAQDLIVLHDDVEVIARVTEVHRWYILYHPFTELTSEPQKLMKIDISYIIFEGGMTQYFLPYDLPPKIIEGIEEDTIKVSLSEYVELPEGGVIDQEMYNKGFEDARDTYKQSAPFWTMMAVTTVTPIIGVIVGALIASDTPKINPSSTPDPTLFRSDPSYREGYLNKAKSKRAKNVIGGFCAGAGVILTYILLIRA